MIKPTKLKEAIERYSKKTGKKMNINLLSKLIKSDLKQNTVWNYLQRASKGQKELPIHIVLEVSRILKVSTDYLLK